MADLSREVNGVYCIKIDMVFGNVSLCIGVKMLGKLFLIPLAVDKERATGLYVVDYFKSLDYVGRIVACDKVGFVDIVRALYRLVAESQMGNSDAAGLLGVVLEVSLYVLVGVVADNLY